MGLIDRLIAVVSPATAMRRAHARLVTEGLLRMSQPRAHYEGASRGRRTSGWYAPGGDATTAQMGALDRLRHVARDMVRNDPWAARIPAVLTQNIVGAGIVPSFRGGAKASRDRLDRVLRPHLESVAIDATGGTTSTGCSG
ncbi:Phage portal protein, lambda family [Methylobrevis pamukkalensis]|uniref:Phage portal protein, lambda family n=1 Tax=Methylobrevis pamukkalensis TaxID=1439726 RepID=A0A1E3H042_9HYPH|nr:Phage portal protein, lambda family [Methylobrevis pamukkalensis]